MRKIILLIIGAAFLSCIKGNEYSFIKEFKVSTPLNLVISTSGGSISTTAGDKNDVVEVKFIVRKHREVLNITFEDLQKYAEVEIKNENNRLEINVVRTIENNIGIGFDIKTPVMTSCSLHTSGGSIKLNGVNGEQIVKTSGGSLHLENITGKTDGKTSGGSISASNIKGDLTAKTSGGGISAENIDGKVDANTSGGSIKINNAKFDVSASTSGGGIELSDSQGQISLSTSGGSITLNNVSGSIEAETSGGGISANILKLNDKLVLKTSGGNIDANIPSGLGLNLNLKGNKVNTDLKNFSGTADKGKIVGKMNGGGIQVEMTTSGGNVNLNYR